MFKRWDFERTSVNCDHFLGPAQVPKSASCKMKILCVLVCTSRACYIFMLQLIASNIDIKWSRTVLYTNKHLELKNKEAVERMPAIV